MKNAALAYTKHGMFYYSVRVCTAGLTLVTSVCVYLYIYIYILIY